MSAGRVDYFFRDNPLAGLHVRHSLRTRRHMFGQWLAFAHAIGKAQGTVLDLGTTPDTKWADSNCMIPWLDEAGFSVSLYSPEDITHLTTVFPRAKVLATGPDPHAVPVGDRSFDWVVSSAVLEHVGGDTGREAHLSECARLADGIFLTTPNRYHWLEFHTKLPLVHWLPKDAHRALLRGIGMQQWAAESHLNLLSHRELRALVARVLGDAFESRIVWNWALGMPSNLVLLAHRKAARNAPV